MCAKHEGAAGFTLVEFVVTVAIAAILISVAVPSFSSSRLNSQLRSSANSFIASTHLARSEAIKRNAPVRLCVSADGITCTAGNWRQGWIVLSGTQVLGREPAISEDFRITATANTAVFTFQPTGVDATAGRVTICRATPAGQQERVITIDATGRSWVQKTSSGTCP